MTRGDHKLNSARPSGTSNRPEKSVRTMHLSARGSWLASLGLVTVVWLTLGCWLDSERRQEITALLMDAERLTHSFQESIARRIDTIDSTLKLLRSAHMRGGAAVDIDIWKHAGNDGPVFQVGFIGSDGWLVSTNLTPDAPRVNLSDREHFRVHADAPAQDILFVSPPLTGRASGKQTIQFSRRVIDPDGRFAGAVVASMRPSMLTELHHAMGESRGLLFLIGLDGRVRARSPADTKAVSEVLERRLAMLVGRQPAGEIQPEQGDGIHAYGAYRQIPGRDLAVAFLVEEQTAMAPFELRRRTALIATAAISLLLLSGGWILGQRTARLARSHEDLAIARSTEIHLVERESWLRSVLTTASDAIVVLDAGGIIRDINPAAERIFGWSRTDLINHSAARLMPATFGAMHDRHVRVHARGGSSAILRMPRELEGVRRDGSHFPLEITVEQWHDGDGRAWYTGIMRDITERKEAALALATSEERFRLLAEHSGDIVALSDIDGTRRYVSPAVERVLGWSPDNVISHLAVEFVHPDDRQVLHDAIHALQNGAAESTATYRHRRSDGSWLWVDGRARVHAPTNKDRPKSYVVVLRDATARMEVERKLVDAHDAMARMALTDGLTQLANRRSFDEWADREWRRCARENLPLSLLLVDADRFKLFNDRYGHRAGDACLQAVAAQLGAVARRPGDLAARYGGEEFVLLMPGTDQLGALHVAERLCAQVQALGIPHEGSPGTGVVTVSIGAATGWPGEPASAYDTLEALISAADAALYAAKDAGRNQVIVADDLLTATAGVAIGLTLATGLTLPTRRAPREK